MCLNSWLKLWLRYSSTVMGEYSGKLAKSIKSIYIQYLIVNTGRTTNCFNLLILFSAHTVHVVSFAVASPGICCFPSVEPVWMVLQSPAQSSFITVTESCGVTTTSLGLLRLHCWLWIFICVAFTCQTDMSVACIYMSQWLFLFLFCVSSSFSYSFSLSQPLPAHEHTQDQSAQAYGPRRGWGWGELGWDEDVVEHRPAGGRIWCVQRRVKWAEL